MKVPLRVSFFTKSLSKGYFFLHRVSLRVPKSGLASLSKGKGPEIRSAHTRHPPNLVPPSPPGADIQGFNQNSYYST